jgi:hypothetical protein
LIERDFRFSQTQQARQVVVDSVLAIPVSYVDRVYALAQARPRLSLEEVLSSIERSEELPSLSFLFDETRLAKFRSHNRWIVARSALPAPREVFSPSEWGMLRQLQPDIVRRRMPVWPQSNRCVNLHLLTDRALPAVYSLNIATAVANYFQAHIRRTEPAGIVDILDVVPGSAAFRYRFSNVPQDVVSGLIIAGILGLCNALVGGRDDEALIRQITQAQRACVQMAEANGLSALTCYTDHGIAKEVEERRLISPEDVKQKPSVPLWIDGRPVVQQRRYTGRFIQSGGPHLYFVPSRLAIRADRLLVVDRRDQKAALRPDIPYEVLADELVADSRGITIYEARLK